MSSIGTTVVRNPSVPADWGIQLRTPFMYVFIKERWPMGVACMGGIVAKTGLCLGPYSPGSERSIYDQGSL